MLRDVSDWTFVSYGERSTLSKEELSSPDGGKYLIKYPRDFQNRVNWEDVNEIVAAKVAELLSIKTIKAEIAYRHGERGCLMQHFVYQFEADFGEPGATFLASEFDSDYDGLQNSELSSKKLSFKCFQLIKNFSYFPLVQQEFVTMQLFDTLIGNQDRHPFNWQILFKNGYPFFGPLFDNGASLGWQLSEEQISDLCLLDAKMNKYFKNTKLKAGILEDTQARLKVQDVLSVCKRLFPMETKHSTFLLEEMNLEEYNQFIDELPLISEVRKQFLKRFIEFRREKVLAFLEKEENKHD